MDLVILHLAADQRVQLIIGLRLVVCPDTGRRLFDRVAVVAAVSASPFEHDTSTPRGSSKYTARTMSAVCHSGEPGGPAPTCRALRAARNATPNRTAAPDVL